jgi:hypothetical protein
MEIAEMLKGVGFKNIETIHVEEPAEMFIGYK